MIVSLLVIVNSGNNFFQENIKILSRCNWHAYDTFYFKKSDKISGFQIFVIFSLKILQCYKAISRNTVGWLYPNWQLLILGRIFLGKNYPGKLDMYKVNFIKKIAEKNGLWISVHDRSENNFGSWIMFLQLVNESEKI